MTTADITLQEWIRDFAEAESRPERVEEWVERISAPIILDVGFRNDAALTHTVVETVRAHWLAFLDSLPQPPAEVRLVGSAMELAREVAQRGHPLTTLFRIYQLAQNAVWSYITTVVDSMPAGEMATRVLVYFWGRAAAWIDASINLSTEIWQTERDRVIQSTAAQRLDVVREALDDPNPDPRALSKALGGHPLSSFNVGALLHAQNTDAIADLASAANRLARALGTRAPLLVTPGGRDIWVWFATQSVPDLTNLHSCDPWLAEREITAAVGEPAEGVRGFQLSHQEAQEVQRLMFDAGLRRPVTLFSEVELLCLMSTSREAANRFAMRRLGDLAGPDESLVRLRQTLHALLRTGSVEKASQELSVHKNTVRYRVGRAEDLMGRSADEAATEVELALRYYDMFVAEPSD